jgi:hypothetical protein
MPESSGYSQRYGIHYHGLVVNTVATAPQLRKERYTRVKKFMILSLEQVSLDVLGKNTQIVWVRFLHM